MFYNSLAFAQTDTVFTYNSKFANGAIEERGFYTDGIFHEEKFYENGTLAMQTIVDSLEKETGIYVSTTSVYYKENSKLKAQIKDLTYHFVKTTKYDYHMGSRGSGGSFRFNSKAWWPSGAKKIEISPLTLKKREITYDSLLNSCIDNYFEPFLMSPLSPLEIIDQEGNKITNPKAWAFLTDRANWHINVGSAGADRGIAFKDMSELLKLDNVFADDRWLGITDLNNKQISYNKEEKWVSVGKRMGVNDELIDELLDECEVFIEDYVAYRKANPDEIISELHEFSFEQATEWNEKIEEWIYELNADHETRYQEIMEMLREQVRVEEQRIYNLPENIEKRRLEKVAEEEYVHVEEVVTDEHVHAEEEYVHAEEVARDDHVYAEEVAIEEHVHDEEVAEEEYVHAEEVAIEEHVHDEEVAIEEHVHDEEVARDDHIYAEEVAIEEHVHDEEVAEEEYDYNAELEGLRIKFKPINEWADNQINSYIQFYKQKIKSKSSKKLKNYSYKYLVNYLNKKDNTEIYNLENIASATSGYFIRKEWHENGQLMSESITESPNDGFYSGYSEFERHVYNTCSIWDEKGNLIGEMNTTGCNGKVDQVCRFERKVWNSEGVLTCEINITEIGDRHGSNNERISEFKTYYDNGKLLRDKLEKTSRSSDQDYQYTAADKYYFENGDFIDNECDCNEGKEIKKLKQISSNQRAFPFSIYDFSSWLETEE